MNFVVDLFRGHMLYVDDGGGAPATRWFCGEGVIAEPSDCDPAPNFGSSLMRMLGDTLGCRSGSVLCQGYDRRSGFA